MKQQEVECVLTYNGDDFDRRMLYARCEKLGILYDYFNKEKFPGIRNQRLAPFFSIDKGLTKVKTHKTIESITITETNFLTTFISVAIKATSKTKPIKEETNCLFTK